MPEALLVRGILSSLLSSRRIVVDALTAADGCFYAFIGFGAQSKKFSGEANYVRSATRD